MPMIMALEGPQLDCLSCTRPGQSQPLSLAGVGNVMSDLGANRWIVLGVGALIGAFAFRTAMRSGHAQKWGLAGARRRRKRRS